MKLNNSASQTWETMTAVLCYIAQAYSPIKIRFASKGLGNSRMFAHDSPAAFLSIYKEKQQQQKKKRGCDSSLLLLFARGVTVPSNFSW